MMFNRKANEYALNLDGNAHREIKKNTIYSKANNIDDVKVPKEVLDTAAQ